jgi:hypothetical protein
LWHDYDTPPPPKKKKKKKKKEKKRTYGKKKLPRWISAGKQKGSQRSNSSAHEKRKIAGQTTSVEPSFMKQDAIAIA